MDPRIGWIQPEQKGPANSLWMHIWETSQGFRVNATTNTHRNFNQHNVSTPAMSCGFYKNVGVALEKSTADGVGAPAGEERRVRRKASLSPSSSSQDSEAESSPVDCLRIDNLNIANEARPYPFISEHAYNANNHRHHQQILLNVPQHCRRQMSSHTPSGINNQHHARSGRRTNLNPTATPEINHLISHTNNGNCPSSWSHWKTRRYSPGVNG